MSSPVLADLGRNLIALALVLPIVIPIYFIVRRQPSAPDTTTALHTTDEHSSTVAS